MVTVGILATFKVKPGLENEVADFLRNALAPA